MLRALWFRRRKGRGPDTNVKAFFHSNTERLTGNSRVPHDHFSALEGQGISVGKKVYAFLLIVEDTSGALERNETFTSLFRDPHDQGFAAGPRQRSEPLASEKNALAFFHMIFTFGLPLSSILCFNERIISFE